MSVSFRSYIYGTETKQKYMTKAQRISDKICIKKKCHTYISQTIYENPKENPQE